MTLTTRADAVSPAAPRTRRDGDCRGPGTQVVHISPPPPPHLERLVILDPATGIPPTAPRSNDVVHVSRMSEIHPLNRPFRRAAGRTAMTRPTAHGESGMGTWGAGPFGHDAEVDFSVGLGEAEPVRRVEVVRAALGRTVDATGRLAAAGEAVAAVALVAAQCPGREPADPEDGPRTPMPAFPRTPAGARPRGSGPQSHRPGRPRAQLGRPARRRAVAGPSHAPPHGTRPTVVGGPRRRAAGVTTVTGTDVMAAEASARP
ncbi:DUF4259 domain-containing protein [Streptomyces sp. DSM 41972]|uniref:DUF4259 domain-containing protein n=1 Tax=Streptomyces althioticus subsp. attaecolombicae TaxID=3075534 RepID=A0ABU3HYI1_9ACTN|nr:DUF4259 domain-containing protein [Streptomyces sp. DSM 41972]SCD45535.1 protein of unknown function [Streptomyces sp. di50b]SCE47631.1 protein of unknown function [Streptomyces sp. di188]